VLIKLKEQTWEVPNEPAALDGLNEQLKQTLAESKEYYSHAIVNGKEIYEAYEDYLQNHIAEIEHVEIVIQTYRQLMDGTLLTLKEYLERALPEIGRLADGFYQGADADVWLRFDDFIEALSWMLEALDSIGRESADDDQRSEFVQAGTRMQEKTMSLSDAIKANDTTMLGDLLSYEIVPELEKLQKVVKNTIDNGVFQHDTNR
jgi:hypothetical protein